jgi:hypothetical protein
MKKVRDGAAHGLENLVSSYDDVATLADVKRDGIGCVWTDFPGWLRCSPKFGPVNKV